MYRIIGSDEKEYGAYTAEQIKAFIREGRANGKTRARLESSPSWKTLADFDEFIITLRDEYGPGQESFQRPRESSTLLGSADAQAYSEKVLAHPYELDVGVWLSRGWDMTMANFGPVLGATAMVLLLRLSISIFVPVIGPIVDLFLKDILMGGLSMFFLKIIREKKADVGVAFSGFGDMGWQLGLVSLVSSLLIGLGLLVFIIPGVYLYVSWMFAATLVIDKKMNFWDALEVSRKVVTRHWFVFFLFVLLQIGIQLGGVILCCVGYFIALPIVIGAKAAAYEDIFGDVPVHKTP